MPDDRKAPGFPLAAFVVLSFVCALWWAKANDPFVRREFSVRTTSGEKANGVVCLAKPGGPRPVVIYLHDAGESMARSGLRLRQLAELGLAAVGLEYSQTNLPHFKEQFAALLEYVEQQPWAQPQARAWFGYGLGGERMLKCAQEDSQKLPQLVIALAGARAPSGTVTNGPTATSYAASATCGFLLVHGSMDEVFPVEGCRATAAFLRAQGRAVSLGVVDGQGHGFGNDRDVIYRVIAEQIARHFGRTKPVVRSSGSYWYCWVPALGMLAWWLTVVVRKNARPRLPISSGAPKGSRWLIAAATCLALLALAQTTVHLLVPRLEVTASSLSVARAWLVPAARRSDFDCLARDAGWGGKPVRELLQHVELADLQRTEFYPELDETVYREFVQSPRMLRESTSEWGWRRVFWEGFYPRVRKRETAVEAAAGVVRFLRERVAISQEDGRGQGVVTSWNHGCTTELGFEEIYVAALRAVGVAARLDSKAVAELWTGTEWVAAPRPLLEAGLPLNGNNAAAGSTPTSTIVRDPARDGS